MVCEVSIHSSKNQLLYTQAINFHERALNIAKELGDINGIGGHLCNIGNIYIDIKEYKKAEIYLNQAQKLATEIHAFDLLRHIEEMYSYLYTQTHQTERAFEHYKRATSLKDSIFNQENTKKSVQAQMNFEFEKQQALEKAEQEKLNAIANEEKQRQKIILLLVSIILIIVALFASVSYRRWRLTQKQKNIIELQNQKIVDSITYAKRIQQSILIEEKQMQYYLADFFIYYQPKDIVSGDFYWCSQINNHVIIAVIDCTGHGVPGAFMSMIGNTLLNQIVNEKHITQPSQILHLLNIAVHEALHQEKDDILLHDGMDMALCCINKDTMQLEYAGAQIPLYIVQNNIIERIKPDKQTIGAGGGIIKKIEPSTAKYTSHNITLQKDMLVYMFTDGYTDQFSAHTKEKFGTKRFKELLAQNATLSSLQQKQLIEKTHLDWKGYSPQIDDILVIGIKL